MLRLSVSMSNVWKSGGTAHVLLQQNEHEIRVQSEI
jgi:hypothetical protein